MWFHVLEDEINHRGQIRLLVQHLPRFQNWGRLGAGFEAVTGDGLGMGLGMRCTQVWEGSPAGQAGLKAGDVVLEYDGHDMPNTLYLAAPIFQPVGVSSHFKVQRGDQVLEFTIERVARG